MRGREAGPTDCPPGGLAAACDAQDAVATWQWDIGRNVVCGDARMAALYGVEPSLLRNGAPVPLLLSRIHPEDRDAVRERIKRAAEEGRSYIVCYRIRPPDGTVRWVLSCGRCTLDAAGRPAEGRGVIIDMADQPAHPLERAAEHSLAVRRAVDDWHDPFLHRLADMMLLEIGRGLAAAQVSSVWKN